ncbi:MAG TPA: VWA domain-containing protein [Candidatus Limnocylindrales bacterium]|nr:VWA domain-containing protein [Candidatus Limnocylindrales bacterium]
MAAGAGSRPVGVSGGAFFWNALLFTRALRAAGLTTDIGAAIDYSRALTLIDIGEREQVRAAGLAIFVRRRDEVPVYDEVFARFWQRHELAIEPLDADLDLLLGQGHEAGERVTEVRPGDGWVSDDLIARALAEAGSETDEGPSLEGESSRSMSWSERERLLHKPFERMSPDELRDAERLVDRVHPRLEMRRSRRQALHRHGRLVAARQMFRRNLQHGGDPVEWLWRRALLRPRSVTIICDISGSMERHSRLLMRFAMALHRVAGVRAEAFVFGTHLTRVTQALTDRDPDAALALVSAAVSDWSGGTRIGESLREFNVRWARRVLRSSGVVIIVSDGWDRGDPDMVRREMARLQRSCHRLIWLDPLAGSDHYQPLAGGMAAAYPFIDDLVAVDDLASLQRLGELLAEMADHRSRRPDRAGRPKLHLAPRLSSAPRPPGLVT